MYFDITKLNYNSIEIIYKKIHKFDNILCSFTNIIKSYIITINK